MFIFSGASKNDKRNFIGAAPSLRATLKSEAGVKNFKDLLVDTADKGIQFQPRNARQVKYYKGVSQPGRKIGPDSIVTVHELAYAIPDFIWSIRTFPDLVVCFGLPALLHIVMECPSILVSYDTTFELGDFYLSVLVLKTSAFQECPCVPIGFVLHEWKFQAVHVEFCEALAARMKKTDVVIVTDGEAAIVNAFASTFPKWHLVACWNHILLDIEYWIKRHAGKSADVTVYKSNVRELLTSNSLAELAAKELTLQAAWSEAFKIYYETHIKHRLLVAYTGHLRSIGLSTDSITTNMSESLNRVIKVYQELSEQTPDLCILSLFRLQLYYRAEMDRASSTFGIYTVQMDSDIKTGEHD